MNRTTVSIGLDIGGTNAKIGLVSRNGNILRSATEPMPHNKSAEHLMQKLTMRIQSLINWGMKKNYELMGMGVSVCGIVNTDGDKPDYINIHALDHYPLRAHFETEFNIPVVLESDMNCAALGEYYFGDRKGTTRLMVTTIATGIGMGMIVAGKLVRTNFGTTGNPGHIIVDPTGPICIAGCRGCLESLCSSSAMSHLAEAVALSQRDTLLSALLAEKKRLTPKDVFIAAEAGDKYAQMLWGDVGRWMGRALATWAGIFGPEVIIVGGGMANAGHWLIDPMEREMRNCGEPYFIRQVKEVAQSSLGVNIAMLGAASMVHCQRDYR